MNGAPPKPKAKASPTTSLIASLALLLHATIGMIALVAWVRTPSIVSWRLLVSFLATLAALGASAALWIAPSKKKALFGLLVLLASLARLGAPDSWTGLSWGVLAGTVLLSLPLVRATFALD